MKRFDVYFLYFLSLSILSFALFGTPSLPHFKHTVVKAAVTHEQKASHKIVFLKTNGDVAGSCTSTAIGPHAVLTAEHCNEGLRSKTVQFDLSLENDDILAVVRDGRDHVIYLLDGAPFKNIEEVKSAPSLLGETVTVYGNDLGSYPATTHYGKAVDCQDPSDLDEDAGERCYTLQIQRGDSGAAIYNTKGQVVGLLTYGNKATDGGATSVGFALNFTPDVYAVAAKF
jgi:hypothetical protein